MQKNEKINHENIFQKDENVLQKNENVLQKNENVLQKNKNVLKKNSFHLRKIMHQSEMKPNMDTQTHDKILNSDFIQLFIPKDTSANFEFTFKFNKGNIVSTEPNYTNEAQNIPNVNNNSDNNTDRFEKDDLSFSKNPSYDDLSNMYDQSSILRDELFDLNQQTQQLDVSTLLSENNSIVFNNTSRRLSIANEFSYFDNYIKNTSFINNISKKNRDLRILVVSTQIPGMGGSATNAYNIYKYLKEKVGIKKIAVVFFESNISEEKFAEYRHKPGVFTCPRKTIKTAAQCVLTNEQKDTFEMMEKYLGGLPDICLCKNYIAPILCKLAYPSNSSIIYLVSGSQSITQFLKQNNMSVNDIFKNKPEIEVSDIEKLAFEFCDFIVPNSDLASQVVMYNCTHPNRVIRRLRTSDCSCGVLSFTEPDNFHCREYDVVFAVSSCNRNIKNYKLVEKLFVHKSFEKYNKLIIGDNCSCPELPNLTILPSQPYERVKEYYGKSKVLLLLSFYDAFPNQPVEALTEGTRVLLSDNIGGYEYLDERFKTSLSAPFEEIMEKIISLVETKNKILPEINKPDSIKEEFNFYLHYFHNFNHNFNYLRIPIQDFNDAIFNCFGGIANLSYKRYTIDREQPEIVPALLESTNKNKLAIAIPDILNTKFVNYDQQKYIKYIRFFDIYKHYDVTKNITFINEEIGSIKFIQKLIKKTTKKLFYVYSDTYIDMSEKLRITNVINFDKFDISEVLQNGLLSEILIITNTNEFVVKYPNFCSIVHN